MTVIEIFLVVLIVYLTVYVLDLVLLLIASLVPENEGSASVEKKTRFIIIIPAHNEEMFIGRLLSSISSQDYPFNQYDTFVVADNCTDNTAHIAM